ncbi:MAG TPA: DUF1326 domain-containing protein [Candidatus Krumholzibacteria bacterium]
MKKVLLALAAIGVIAITAPGFAADAAKDWNMKATIIEACSCPMFCQCYFNTEPAGAGAHGHGGHDASAAAAGHAAGAEHFCKFNNAFRVDNGMYGATKLDGAKFWVAGDLGAEFTDGEMDWAVLTFDPAVTPEQREGIKAILGSVYPVKWKSFTVAPDAKMDWSYTKDRAEAKMDGGKTAEVVLNRGEFGNTADPIVIKNLKYWGVPRNDGFVLMKNEVEAYRAGDKAFEYKGTNGFMITFDMSSKDAKM